MAGKVENKKLEGVTAEYPATQTNFCVAGYAVRSEWYIQ